jgi:hypothetical protein
MHRAAMALKLRLCGIHIALRPTADGDRSALLYTELCNRQTNATRRTGDDDSLA